MNIAGGDLGLVSTGLALPGRTLTIVGRGRGVERLAQIQHDVGVQLANEEIDLVMLEGYAFTRELAGARSIGELGGVIRLLLYRMGIAFAEVHPMSLKVFATGSGKADKIAMMQAARKLVPWETFDSSDACDAWWCRMVGLAITGKLPFGISSRQTQAMAGVQVPNGILRRARAERERGRV